MAGPQLEEEIERPGLDVNLTWSRPFRSREDVKNDPIGTKTGFYIAFSLDPRKVKHGIPGAVVHKVGKAETSFTERFAAKEYGGWSFYLAEYAVPRTDPAVENAIARVLAIEHAIARTLMRAGEVMRPHHKKPRDILQAIGPITIMNPLPHAWAANLSDAYTKPSPAANFKPRPDRPLVKPPPPYDAAQKHLSLRKGQRWEIDNWSL